MKTTTRKVLAIALACSFGAFALVGCEAPEQTEAPATQESAEATDAEESATAEADTQADESGEPEAPEGAPAGEAPQGMNQQQPGQQQPGQPGQEPPQMGQAPDMGEVTSEQLDEFAAAFKEVQALQGDFQERIQGVESQEEAQQVQQEIVSEIEERVESTGMAFQDYMMMAQRLEQDVELQQRLESRL